MADGKKRKQREDESSAPVQIIAPLTPDKVCVHECMSV
jgi:hypothetical protein